MTESNTTKGLVLVIDDERGPRESLRFLLKTRYDVICCDSVDEGIAALNEHGPDVIVLDIRMPRKTGLDGLREIRELDPAVSVIMLTGFGALETAQEAMRFGATDYIKKPFDADEMIAVIERGVERTRIQRMEKRKARTSEELRQLNEQLMQQLEEREHLAHLGQASAEFVHDLRNPLTIVVGYVQLLASQFEEELGGRGEDDPEAKEYLDVIERNLQRCHELARTWQNLGKQGDDHTEPMSLTRLVNDIVMIVKPVARRQGTQLVCRLHPADLMVQGNSSQLARALHNIFANAIQAVGEKGGGQVTVTCGPADELLEVSVADNGVGMSAEQVEKAFDPYFSTKASGKGTGLGLSITRRIVEEHGGVVTLESREGEGTRVDVRLPPSA